MQLSSLLALVAPWSGAIAVTAGFNYAATYTNGTVLRQSDFQSQFQAAQELTGANGMFTAARLYTSIQGGTASDPTGAIPAAIATKTRLLLGLWASSGSTTITNEINAITAAMKQYGSKFTDLVDGVSVGSEDLYRTTSTSLSFDPKSVGASPDAITGYIKQVRQALKGTALGQAPIGHVDTWSAWANSSNSAVVNNCDFLGTDIYSYFQTGQPNNVGEAKGLFNSALQQAKAASQGKPVWIAETGWPVSGATINQGVPSAANAAQYWQDIGCGTLFGNMKTYWFTYFEDGATPDFGMVDQIGGRPRFDLRCKPSSQALDASSPSNSTGSTSSSGSASSAASSSAAVGSESASASPSASSSDSSAPASSALPSSSAGPSPVPASSKSATSQASTRMANCPWLLSCLAAAVFMTL